MIVVSNFNEHFKPIADVTIPVLRQYCERHGYRHVITNYEVIGGGATHSVHWGKIKAILKALKHGEPVAYIDTDAMITNPDIRFDELLYGDLTLCQDDNGFNAGVMIARPTTWVINLFDRALESREYYGEERNGEQTAIAYFLIASGCMSRVHVHQQRTMNSYWENWKPGDFILHLPNRSDPERLRIFPLAIEQADCRHK